MSSILSSHPPEIAVRLLVDAANEAGGPDNITVIVARGLPAAPHARSTA
jgi:serine/threonine protein phosphatase PrpC